MPDLDEQKLRLIVRLNVRKDEFSYSNQMRLVRIIRVVNCERSEIVGGQVECEGDI